MLDARAIDKQKDTENYLEILCNSQKSFNGSQSVLLSDVHHYFHG